MFLGTPLKMLHLMSLMVRFGSSGTWCMPNDTDHFIKLIFCKLMISNINKLSYSVLWSDDIIFI